MMKPFFTGHVDTRWLDDGRRMLLLADFMFTTSKGVECLAPKGSIVDGASIPKAFWTVWGSPFVGLWRNGSVVHDVMCVTRVMPWLDVHEMFREACICKGVGEASAWLMYEAIMTGGPRWDKEGKDVEFDYSVYDDGSES